MTFLFNLIKGHYNIDFSDKLLFCRERITHVGDKKSLRLVRIHKSYYTNMALKTIC